VSYSLDGGCMGQRDTKTSFLCQVRKTKHVSEQQWLACKAATDRHIYSEFR
jgi:hypothetical protein